LQDGDLAVTINKTDGDFDTKWSGYLNFFIQSGTGVLGYAPLGGAGNGDGVVIDATAFGLGGGCGSVRPEAPYTLGRTSTHEVGHYLNLDHIWGDGCGQDDGVADTPNSDQEYYDCPSIGENTCGSVDMHMNYMDYTNDACMYMFSAGQATVCEDYVNASLSILSNNASNVIGGVNNGDSTGGGIAEEEDNTDNGELTMAIQQIMKTQQKMRKLQTMKELQKMTKLQMMMKQQTVMMLLMEVQKILHAMI